MTVAQLALRLGGELIGPGDAVLRGVADLREAGPDELAFVANRRYRKHLGATRAGAVLVEREVSAPGVTLIRVDDPYLAFARALALFSPPRWPAPGVDDRAAVSPLASLGEGVTVEPFVFVGEGAVVGAGSWLQAGAYVGAGASLGAGCRLMPGAVVMEGCVLGARVWLNPGAVVGGEGFGFAPSREGLVKIPQVGGVVIEDDVELGANTCVDRAALGVTTVRQGAKLDNLCQVGHGATIGPHNVLVAYSGVAGSTRLGVGVTVAARSSILGHLEIGDGVTVAAHSMVAQDAPAGAKLAGVPAYDHRRWLRASREAEELPELTRALRQLQARVEAIEAQTHRPIQAETETKE
ncbi:MAG: UDP-3-O-(3-hydroxymyristoyl)glucosamine N-acyltransferase [Deltaproteobacteria bacterium]|nr:UDP-3-O-(3-hydroxymyristoyl)glucosamine N-acyltransferase [Deltaproteobacteria bacterium]